VTQAPQRVAVAGDWHGNTGWAIRVITEAAEILHATENHAIFLHLGDFGIWPGPGGRAYLHKVLRTLRENDAELWFIDGNHEDFNQLGAFRRDSDGRGHVAKDPLERVTRIWHLPRGYRWQWHGRTWLACGGAVSVDKAIRTKGKTWWPQEEITDAQEASIIAGGPADVLITHDCPSGVVHSFPPPPDWWAPRDLARSDAHRERLQRIVDATRPAHIAHGHLHMAYQRCRNFGYGPVQVTGFDRDEGRGPNWAILNVETMDWEMP
jgi:hypothetical protein